MTLEVASSTEHSLPAGAQKLAVSMRLEPVRHPGVEVLHIQAVRLGVLAQPHRGSALTEQKSRLEKSVS